MKILIAPDSFKGSLGALEAAQAIARGLRSASDDIVAHCIPMADGGEGTLEALLGGGYTRVTAPTQDALGRGMLGHYGLDRLGRRVVVELAVASGLPQLLPQERQPLRAGTYGTGLLLQHALEQLGAGPKEVLLCLGGSATTEAGTGILHALGWGFLDAEGRALAAGGAALAGLAQIVAPSNPLLAGLRLAIACDVTNPLTGAYGAAAVYGPQKGASPAQVALLDAALEHFAAVTQRCGGADVRQVAGSGAAGGTAGGLLALLPLVGVEGTLQSGAALVAWASGLEAALERPWSLVITGEGSLDAQTSRGKVVAQVAALAQAAGVPCVALCGQVQPDAVRAVAGLSAAFALANGPLTLAESQQRAGELLSLQAEQLAHLLLAQVRQV